MKTHTPKANDHEYTKKLRGVASHDWFCAFGGSQPGASPFGRERHKAMLLREGGNNCVTDNALQSLAPLRSHVRPLRPVFRGSKHLCRTQGVERKQSSEDRPIQFAERMSANT